MGLRPWTLKTEKEFRPSLLEVATPVGLVFGSGVDTTLEGTASVEMLGDTSFVAVASVAGVVVATGALVVPTQSLVDNFSVHTTVEVVAWQIFSDLLPPGFPSSGDRSDLKKTDQMNCFLCFLLKM